MEETDTWTLVIKTPKKEPITLLPKNKVIINGVETEVELFAFGCHAEVKEAKV
jgi:hypothetical protein